MYTNNLYLGWNLLENVCPKIFFLICISILGSLQDVAPGISGVTNVCMKIFENLAHLLKNMLKTIFLSVFSIIP